MKFFKESLVTIVGIIIATSILGSHTVLAMDSVSTSNEKSFAFNPSFIEVSPIAPELISQASRFRSTVGHPYYSGPKLKCQSEKHYFEFCDGIPADKIEVKSPCFGTITTIRHEEMGDQIEIIPDPKVYHGYQDQNIAVIIFHIKPDTPFFIGQKLTSGQRLGTHYTLDTYSDIAVRNSSAPDATLSSAFLYMPKSVLDKYGVANPYQMIISQQERDKYPSDCKNDRDPMPDPPKGAPENWEKISSCK